MSLIFLFYTNNLPTCYVLIYLDYGASEIKSRDPILNCFTGESLKKADLTFYCCIGESLVAIWFLYDMKVDRPGDNYLELFLLGRRLGLGSSS